MLSEISSNWWLFLVRGLVAIIFGVLAFIWPGQAWFALIVLFGVYALLDGMFTMVAGIDFNRYFNGGWAVILEGVAGIVIGILTLIWPNQASHVLFYFIAAWAVITGIFEIVAAIQFRFFVLGEWAMILAGVLSILLGVLLFVYPGTGVVSLVWAIGIYAIVFGITQIIFSARLNGLRRELKSIDVPGF